MSDTHHRLLAAFGQMVGIPAMGFDGRQHCALVFGETEIDLEYLEGRDCLLAYARVGEMPAGEANEHIRRLFDLSSASSLSGKGCFAVDPDSRAIFYVDRITIGQMSEIEFAAALGAMADDLEFWKVHLAHMAQNGLEDAAGGLDATHLFRI